MLSSLNCTMMPGFKFAFWKFNLKSSAMIAKNKNNPDLADDLYSYA